MSEIGNFSESETGRDVGDISGSEREDEECIDNGVDKAGRFCVRR